MTKKMFPSVVATTLVGLVAMLPMTSMAASIPAASAKPAPTKTATAKPLRKPSKKASHKKVAVAKPAVKPAAKSVTTAKPVAQAALSATKATTNLVKSETPIKPTSTESGETGRQIEFDGYSCMLPAQFGAPQHEVMQIPTDETKSRMVALSMYAFTTPNSDKAFMSSFNEADITNMPPDKLKTILESGKVSYLKEIPNPEELSSKMTTFQGHPAILFDVKETTKTGTLVYSKVMGLLKPGGYYQFAFVSHDQADLTQPWVQQVFDSIRFAK